MDPGSGWGREPWRETAISEYVLQVKLTSVADGWGGSVKQEKRVGGHSLMFNHLLKQQTRGETEVWGNAGSILDF